MNVVFVDDVPDTDMARPAASAMTALATNHNLYSSPVACAGLTGSDVAKRIRSTIPTDENPVKWFLLTDTQLKESLGFGALGFEVLVADVSLGRQISGPDADGLVLADAIHDMDPLVRIAHVSNHFDNPLFGQLNFRNREHFPKSTSELIAAWLWEQWEGLHHRFVHTPPLAAELNRVLLQGPVDLLFHPGRRSYLIDGAAQRGPLEGTGNQSRRQTCDLVAASIAGLTDLRTSLASRPASHEIDKLAARITAAWESVGAEEQQDYTGKLQETLRCAPTREGVSSYVPRVAPGERSSRSVSPYIAAEGGVRAEDGPWTIEEGPWSVALRRTVMFTENAATADAPFSVRVVLPRVEARGIGAKSETALKTMLKNPQAKAHMPKNVLGDLLLESQPHVGGKVLWTWSFSHPDFDQERGALPTVILAFAYTWEDGHSVLADGDAIAERVHGLGPLLDFASVGVFNHPCAASGTTVYEARALAGEDGGVRCEAFASPYVDIGGVAWSVEFHKPGIAFVLAIPSVRRL